ncbi:hypothetical protein BV25DRAFT_434001 [Artomyces pyxidatus]|uniref:Uncharacterized protein n=1 Tax=Artomyces pyxidatus TaxID=48021 RepID=A0ACB8T647_9AGAM|nr:hypothetical protein BV25DRAFT_434001 [Artomyces pyxidatus]
MPLRSTTPKSPSTSPPYPSLQARRTPGQPKSTRQQFSACGACRMRRVRCDLKDLPFSNAGHQQHCSNCKERGIKCVDEFAQVKAVKLLRRGRRLQQVEAFYGKTMDEEGGLFSTPSLSPSLIPKLKPEFFSSAFFRRLHVQHPIIDPSEFCARFFEFTKGNLNALGIAGQLVTMTLVIWAASFGVNEYGIEQAQHGANAVRNRQENTREMVREMLQLIDIHGITRKPTWDGVRALLLLLPLTEEVLTPLERMVMQGNVMHQVYLLCSHASLSSVGSGQGAAVDILVRARIFWYSQISEGVKCGLHGGRLLLSDEDLESFRDTLPAHGSNSATRPNQAFEFAQCYANVALDLGSVCRKIHAVLTGPRARRCDQIDEQTMHEVWAALDKCWKDFDDLRKLGTSGNIQEEDVDRYIHGWQICIFECLCVIREALKQRLVVHSTGDAGFEAAILGAPSQAPHDAAPRLLRAADAKCHERVHDVVSIIRLHVGTAFFEYDTTLVRDGCFYAGYLLAGERGEEADVQVCLQALHQMRWAFAKGEEKERTIRMAYEARKMVSARHSPIAASLVPATFDLYPKSLQTTTDRPIPPPLSIPPLSSGPMDISAITDLHTPSTASTEESTWASPPLSASSSGAHSPRDDATLSLRSSPASNNSPTFFTSAQLHSAPFNSVSPASSASSDLRAPSPLMFFTSSDLGQYTFSPSLSLPHTLLSSHASTSSLRQSQDPRSAFQDSISSYHAQSPSTYFSTRSEAYSSGGASPTLLNGGSALDSTFTLQPSFFQ